MNDLDRFLRIATHATGLAADLIRTRQPGNLTAKGDRDYASEVDFAIEGQVRALLAAVTPDVAFLGEEGGGSDASGTDLLWALDPIDGTVNFAHSVPLCGISLGLIADGRPIVGVIELPFLGNRYTAVLGGGAHRDGQAIRVSTTSNLKSAVVCIGDYAVGPTAIADNAARLAVTQALAQSALRVRMFGSAAVDLAWLAEGKTDAAITLSNKPWDTAAGVIIAREAGACVVDRDSTDHTVKSQATIAAAPALIDEVVSLVQAATDFGAAA